MTLATIQYRTAGALLAYRSHHAHNLARSSERLDAPTHLFLVSGEGTREGCFGPVMVALSYTCRFSMKSAMCHKVPPEPAFPKAVQVSARWEGGFRVEWACCRSSSCVTANVCNAPARLHHRQDQDGHGRFARPVEAGKPGYKK